MKQMTRLLFVLSVFFTTGSLTAQNNVPESMLGVDFSMVDWERGEILVRFADHLSPSLNTTKSQTKIGAVDAVLADYSEVRMEQLFPVQKPIPGGEQGFTTYSGKYYEYPKLTNIYKISFKDTAWDGIFPIIRAFEALGDDYIVYAEPNYHFESLSAAPLTNDAKLNQQWSFAATKSDSIRKEFTTNTESDSSIVIAVLDSGVDTLHLDLRNKIHKNPLELNGSPGVDDDGNGYIDDIWGWDFVNGDNQPLDNLGHGTHCASIAAAENDNSIGIAGIAQDAKVTSYQVLESNNGGTSSNIAQGVALAAMSGSDILSMSLGGYGRSLALENALQYAYGFSFLVASAGNDGICIRADGQKCPDGALPMPSYPAAYSFVLGVQATKPWNYQGFRVSWSNYDYTGPYWSDYPDKFNYEVNAPGYQILGALAAGNSGNYNRYASWNGTSMAAPVVSGMVSLFKTRFPSATNEEIFVKFINSWYYTDSVYTKGNGYPYNHLDLVEAFYGEEPATPFMVDFDIIDTIQGNNDGNPDGGEIISLIPTIKNVGGFADSIWVKLTVGKFEDSTMIDAMMDSVFIGSLSEFGQIRTDFNPLTFQIDSNIANYRNLRLRLVFNSSDDRETDQEFNIRVTNGRKFNAGLYSGTTTLYPKDLNIIDGNVVFDTLVIKPGAIVRFAPQKSLSFNYITCEGTKDSIITFTKYGNAYGKWGFIRSNLNNYIPEFKYCRFEYAQPFGSYAALIKAPQASSGGGFVLEDCIIENCDDTDFGIFWQLDELSRIERCVFMNNFPSRAVISNVKGELVDNLFADNFTGGCPSYGGANHGAIELGGFDYNNNLVQGYPKIRGNSIFGNRQICDYYGSQTKYQVVAHEYSAINVFTVSKLSPNYYGFANADSIEAGVLDNGEFPFFGVVEASDSAMNAPSASSHGHIWKIEIDSLLTSYNDVNTPFVNGGDHTIKVYFNRPMDISKTPIVKYGPVFPHNTYTLLDSTYWSEDSTIFYSKFNLDPTSVINGTMGISVSDYIDNENFPGPRETDRFKFNISTYGALSFGFNASGDTSSIHLDWRTPIGEFTIIGYDLFRYDSTSSPVDTIRLNSSPILDTIYTDYSVAGGIDYYYYFKAIKTSLEYTDASGVVSARSLTAKPIIQNLTVSSTTNSSAFLSAEINAKDLQTTYSWILIDPTGSAINSLTNTLPLEDMTFQQVVKSYSGLSSGLSYSALLKAENTNGITYSDTVDVITKSTPTLTITGANQICLGDSVALSVQSVTPDTTMSLEWRYNGSVIGQGTSVKYFPTSQGTYSIELVAEGSYTTTTNETYDVSVVSGVSNNVTIAYTGSTQLCQGDALTLALPSGYTDIVWNTGDTTSTITASQTGTYSATMKTSGVGCSFSSNTVNVTVAANPSATVSSTSGNSICDGAITDLTAPSGMSSYKWYKGGTPITGANSNTLTVATAGNYQVEVTNSSGCSTLSSVYGMTVNPLPTGSISNASSLEFCQGDSVVLSGPAGMTYAWSTGETSPSISVSNTATVGLTLTNSDGCSAALPSVDVIENQIPNLTVVNGGALEFCFGGSVNLQASGGFASYAWNNGSSSQSIIATSTGTYTVTGTTSDGCTATSVAQSVVVNPNPVATVTNSGNSTLCSGDSATLTAPAGMSSYLWSDGSTTQSITTPNAGNYAVTVTNADGCSATSAAVGITTSNISTPTITASGSTSICSGSSVTLSVPTGYASYTWSDGSTTNSISPNATGNYSVTVTNADGCSTTTTATSVSVNTPPTASITSTGTGSICTGASETLSGPTGMSSYQWYLGGNAISGATSSSYTASSVGNYSLSVVDANGCSASSTLYSLSAAVPPVATVTNSGNSMLCSGDSATLTAPAGMSSYLWSDGSTTQSITTPNAGNYAVTVTNADGCSATSAATTITTSQITAPSITASGVLEFCDGGSVTLGVPMGYASYAWNTNALSTQLTANQSGDYYVSVTNSDGCSITSDTVTVVVNLLPAKPTITYTANDTLMISSATQGNQWYFNGVSMSGETNDTLRPYNFGNYSVMTMDANGCESSMSAMQFYNSIGATEDLMSQLSMYPNPTTGSVTLRFGTLEVDEVTVQDALGRVITTLYPEDAELRISLEEQPAGMYMIRVRTATGQVLNLNVAKQ